MLVFRLYITGAAPSSLRALANLKTICRDYFPGDYRIEIVDTLREPLRTMQDGIIVTPALVKLSPEPQWTIIGDLSEDARVLESMREAKGEHEKDRTYSDQDDGRNAATAQGRFGSTDRRTNAATRSRRASPGPRKK